MKKLFTFMLLLLSILTGSAWGATRYFGTVGANGECLNTSADSVGLGVPEGSAWYRKLNLALTASSSGDSIVQVGAAWDTLASAYSCSNKALAITGMAGKTIKVTGYKVTFSGTGAIKFYNADLVAALSVSKSAVAFTATGSTFTHPGTGTDVAVVGFGIGFDASPMTFTSCTFDSCDVTNGDLGEVYFYSGSAAAASQTFTGCTFNTSDLTAWNSYSSGGIVFNACDFTGGGQSSDHWISFATGCDVDSVAFNSCTFDMDESTYTTVAFSDVSVVRVNECAFSYWSLSSISNSPCLYFTDAATNARPKTIWITSNTISVNKAKAVGSGSFIKSDDKDAGPVWHVTGNTMNADNANEVDWFIRSNVYGSNCDISNNTLYAGCMYFGMSAVADDTLEANIGTGWTFEGNVIDHTNWSPTSGPSTALTFCPSSSTLTGNTIKSSVCSHLVLMNDDVVAAGTWRAGDNGWGASHNTFNGNTYQQVQAAQIAYGIVDKGFANSYYNETFIAGGSTGSTSRAWFLVGDNLKVYNCDITLTDGGGGAHSVFDDGAWSGDQARDNVIYNNLVRGAADYAVISSSGDGSGWSESHNCWALDVGTAFDADEATMATTSFTDSTSWRMKWGGKTGLTGITASTFGTVAIGANVNPASYGKPVMGSRDANIPGHWWIIENINNNGWPASEDSLEDKDDWYQIMKPVSPSDNVQYRLWIDEYYKLDKSDQKILWKVEGVSSGMATYYGHYRWLDSLTSHGASLGDSLDDATWQPIPKPLNMSDELQLYIFRKAYFQLPDTTRKKMFWKVLAQATNFKDWDGYWPILEAIPGTFAASDEYDPSTWFTIPKPRNKSDEEMLAYYMDEYFLLPDETRDKMYWKINQ